MGPDGVKSNGYGGRLRHFAPVETMGNQNFRWYLQGGPQNFRLVWCLLVSPGLLPCKAVALLLNSGSQDFHLHPQLVEHTTTSQAPSIRAAYSPRALEPTFRPLTLSFSDFRPRHAPGECASAAFLAAPFSARRRRVKVMGSNQCKNLRSFGIHGLSQKKKGTQQKKTCRENKTDLTWM